MTLARRLRAAMAAAAVVCLTGCAHLPSFLSGPTKDDATATSPAEAAANEASAASAAAANARAEYRIDVRAPAPLQRLLLNYLDLARFQSAPATEGITAAELERLMRAAPAQARELLETEGYFNAVVTVTRSDDSSQPTPLLIVAVNPGPRATVSAFQLDVSGDLLTSSKSGDTAATREIENLRNQWPLRRGDVFRQGAWVDAKNSTLARVRADGYAAAAWRSTSANVDAPDNSVAISNEIESGPLFRLGAIRIEGLERYDADSVRKLANFNLGAPYNEQTLLDFQERIQKVGLFEGATVELDADVKTSTAAPVIVRVKELPLQQATIGVGYSANTGARLSVEHTQRKLFGSRWIAKNKFQLGTDLQSWEGELTSHPLDALYRNLISGSAQRLRADDQLLLSWDARIGRTQDTPRIERLYFAELTHARVDSAPLTTQADAVSINYNWIVRRVDSVLLPTKGLTATAQVGIGLADGNRLVTGEQLEKSRGPFSRLYSRLTFYEPLGSSWYGTARVEGGQVFSRSAVGIPDTLLFRAGGDDSVRGYGYRTLGPTIAGVTTGGRTLLTGSIEVARPISPSYPAYWWAAFIDAGNAADRWIDLKPDVGYGVGLRWRSPVGPLRVDVAYGEQVKQVRLHLSVGIAF